MNLQQERLCTRCLNVYPLTTDYFYPARRINRRKIGWQSYCIPCWKDINLANKTRRKEIRKQKKVVDDYFKVVSV